MTPDPRTAICPGTYDPVTNGHLDVVRRASAMFDRVIVAVVDVPIRKNKTLFSTQERMGFIAEATRHHGNVEVKSFDTLIVDFAHRCDARAIVKGLRTITDFGYEFEMNSLNHRQAPDVESVYLMSSPQYSFLSSSGVKELATFGGNIDDMVPEGVARRLKEELSR